MKMPKLAYLSAIVLASLALNAIAQDKKGVSQSEMNYQAGASPLANEVMYQSTNPKAPQMSQAEYDRILREGAPKQLSAPPAPP